MADPTGDAMILARLISITVLASGMTRFIISGSAAAARAGTAISTNRLRQEVTHYSFRPTYRINTTNEDETSGPKLTDPSSGCLTDFGIPMEKNRSLTVAAR